MSITGMYVVRVICLAVVDVEKADALNCASPQRYLLDWFLFKHVLFREAAYVLWSILVEYNTSIGILYTFLMQSEYWSILVEEKVFAFC